MAQFFQTSPGQYGEGDTFVGVMVPQMRLFVRSHRGSPISEIDALVDGPVHEVRLTALLLLVEHSKRSPAETLEHYLDALRRGRVNNWDLVDLSAKQVLGSPLRDGDRALLDTLAASESWWERRAAVVATFAFLFDGDATTSVVLAERLLGDPHPLIRKAVGWMLREAGARVSRDVLLGFLDVHATAMPRIMLSCAVEHLDPDVRAYYRALRQPEGGRSLR